MLWQEAFSAIDRDPSTATLRRFGAQMLVTFAAVAAVLWLALGRPAAAIAAGAAGAAVLAVSRIPRVGRVVYVGWMGLGAAIGVVTSPVVLFLMFALVFVPAGLITRLAGRDPLLRRPDRGAPSYWQDYPRPRDPKRYLRQY